MLNHFFIKIKEKTKLEIEKQEHKQRTREDHLRELESELDALQNTSVFHIPHPIKTHKKRREIEQLEKEISDYKVLKKTIPLLICMVISIIVIILLGVMTSSDSSGHANPQIIAIKNANIVTGKTGSAESVIKKEPIRSLNEMSTSDTTPPPDEIPASEEMPFAVSQYAPITFSNLTISTQTDFSHIDSDTVNLGTDEGVTISISVSTPNITANDLVFLYDDSLLDMKIKEPVNDDNSTLIETYITGKVSCSTDLFILTSYDLETLEEEAKGYQINLCKLDATNGQIVYITPSGKKYHYSSNCAGLGAIQTTYFDALSGEYTPCKKCV